MNNTKILHITAHLGGGVGSVLLNYFKKVKSDTDCVHTVVCLDYANEKAKKVTSEIDMNLYEEMSLCKKELFKLIETTDIVFIHWWNHPLLFDFLVREKLPECRLVMWSHNSGVNPPGVYTNKLLNYADRFVFTTPMSFNTAEIKSLSEDKRNLLRAIWASGGVEDFKHLKHKSHSGFIIGYIGTVDYCKMHSHFLTMSNDIAIPNVKFIVCGGLQEKEIEQEAKELGIQDKFSFKGVVPIKKYLEVFDVFGYPLGSSHYGTCDQTLQESMAAGIVPVVLANAMETFMVEDGVTGIVANNEKDYVNAIEKLYADPILRNKLSKNAQKYAISTFTLENMENEWNKVIEELMAISKTTKQWPIGKPSVTIKDVFLESLGTHGKPFSDYCDAKSDKEKTEAIESIKELAKSVNWQTETKGTIYHYNRFFPNDPHISRWDKIMREAIFKVK